MYDVNQVHKFINHFHAIDKNNDITDTFTCGCCYWFAYILCTRFPESEMMYDPIINHFVAKIDDRLYDITGDVTDKYNVVSWNEFDDEFEKKRIISYCIDFDKE